MCERKMREVMYVGSEFTSVWPKQSKKQKGSWEGRRKQLLWKSSKESSSFKSALIRAASRHQGPVENPILRILCRRLSTSFMKM